MARLTRASKAAGATAADFDAVRRGAGGFDPRSVFDTDALLVLEAALALGTAFDLAATFDLDDAFGLGAASGSDMPLSARTDLSPVGVTGWAGIFVGIVELFLTSRPQQQQQQQQAGSKASLRLQV